MYTACFFVVMLAPAAMLLVGLMWKIFPPPHQSKGLVYNTELTQKNPDAWKMAHQNCAKLWMRIGVISGVSSAALMIIFQENWASFWVWVIVGQMSLFCVSVFMVDLLLKSTFSDQGGDNKKE